MRLLAETPLNNVPFVLRFADRMKEIPPVLGIGGGTCNLTAGCAE
jgi:hypothetical protein